LSTPSSFLDGEPDLTSKRQPSAASGSSSGSTHVLAPSFVDRRKDDTSGTKAPLAAGSGERMVRAHIQATILALLPFGRVTSGYTSARRAFAFRKICCA